MRVQKLTKLNVLSLALISAYPGGCQRGPEATAPQEPLAIAARTATNVRFATIGDSGWDGTALSDVSNLIHSWNPDHILALGDNNHDNGAASNIDPNIGKYFHDYISRYTGSYGAGAEPITEIRRAEPRKSGVPFAAHLP